MQAEGGGSVSGHDAPIVYALPGGSDYCGLVDGEWYRWPAVADGWFQRRRCREAQAEGGEELEPRLARLAVMLSGGEWRGD